MNAQEQLSRRLERAKQLQAEREKRESEQLKKDKKEDEKVEDKKASAQKEAAAIAAALNAATNPVALAAASTVNPQIALQAAAAAVHAQVLAQTGIAVPNFYNPMAVNPVHYAEQEKKRKQLWAKKAEEKTESAPSSNNWEKTSFGDDATRDKFRRLMGIKGAAADTKGDDGGESARLMDQLDHDYQTARIKTHTQRSFGLGFGTSFSVATQPAAAPAAPSTSKDPPKKE